MITIVTSRTRRLYSRPPSGPWTLNLGSPQARGLKFWLPINMGGQVWTDYISGTRATITGPSKNKQDATVGELLQGTGSEYLEWTLSPISAYPFTLSAWFLPWNIGNNDSSLIALYTSTTSYYELIARVGVGGDPLQAYCTGGVAASAGSLSDKTLYHGAAIFPTDTSSRIAILNGRIKGTNSSTVAFGSLSTVRINNGAWGTTLRGGGCHYCVWNRALSDAEVYALYDPATRWDLYYPLGRKTWGLSVPNVNKGMTFVRHRARTLRRM